MKPLVTNSQALLVRSVPLAAAVSQRLICLANNRFCFFLVFVVELPDLLLEGAALLKSRRKTRPCGAMPTPAGQRAAEIIGRVKPNSLLAGHQEAVCLRMVAGASNAEYYTQPDTFWVDLIP